MVFASEPWGFGRAVFELEIGGVEDLGPVPYRFMDDLFCLLRFLSLLSGYPFLWYPTHLELGFYLTEFHELWYFCRGLSENMERRSTDHVYNEIITCRTIFLNLEESRSHGNERETGQPRGQGARPPPWAPAQVSGPIRTKLLDRAPPT